MTLNTYPIIIYIAIFMLGFYVGFKILAAIKIERFFNPDKVLEKKLAYIVGSIIIAHLLGSVGHLISQYIIILIE